MEQRFMGEKARSEGAPSPALSHLSMKSDQSMDRPVAFSNETPSYTGYENVRPDEAPSPATSYFSLKSNNSMDRPIAFKDRTQPYSLKRLRRDEAPSPAPSHLSVRSEQSMDLPIAFNNETPSYNGLRPNDAPSPATSYFSLKCNQSMDRPIAFKDITQPYSLQRLRPDETPSPAPSLLSIKSDQSIDRPIAFNNGTPSYNGLRPDEAPSPATSYFSLKSNNSMDRPIAFKDRTQPYSVKNMKLDESPSPAPSFLSVKSEQSMDRPIAFRDEAESYRLRRLKTDATSPAPSLKSDQSMDRPIKFYEGSLSYKSNKRLRSEEAMSSTPSCKSQQSDQSLDRPMKFNDEIQSFPKNKSFKERISAIIFHGEKPYDEQSSLQKVVFSTDISTLSATLLTEDHYKCPVCTEVFKDPVSMPCGHSYCKHCIESYWSKPTHVGAYACPQCRKRFRDRPVLNVNVALAKLIEELQKAGFSPALPAHCYSGPEDVPCDICTEMKLKAVKSCLTCSASYCETHVRQHYTVPALQRHNLVEATVSQDSKDTMELQVSKMQRVIEEQGEEIRELKTKLSGQSMIYREEEDEFSRLIKVFNGGLPCNDLPADVTEVAALDRLLDIGMLYDCRNNSFTSDTFLWDKQIIASNRVSQPQLKTKVKVLEDDSLQERCRAFEMSPMLRVSALCGLMELNGSAAFLNHPVQSQYQDRVTLHYKTTTRLDMISQRLLQEGASPSVINRATATHVIIAVFYGVQAFFVFNNERNGLEKNKEMENVIKKITTTHSGRGLFTSLNETEKANSNFYDCSLYSDVGSWKNSLSFDKALEIYDSLPMLLGSKDERAVPLRVWLYPLKKLNKSSVCAALSENVLQRAENILEHLREQIRVCKDIITNYNNLSVIMWFPVFKEKCQRYSEFLQEYRTEFQRKTAKIIESIHMNEEERENSLQELVSNYDLSLFNPENTHHWFEKKEAELAVLKRCRAANITIVKSQEELQQVVNDPLMSSVFCFTISSKEADDSFFTALKQYLDLMKNGTLTTSDFIKSEDLLQSLKPVYITQKVLSDLEVFISAKKTNEDGKQTKFIAASVPDDGYSEYTVQYYYAGRIVSRNLKLQTKPDLIQISHINYTSVSLKLNQAQNKSIDRYVVEYRALDDDDNDDEIKNTTWKHIIFDATTLNETCFISGLKSDHHYQLRYSVIEQDCMSNFSKMINFHTAFVATPGQPFVKKLNRDTLRLFWLKAEAGEDFPVLWYMVEYKEAGLEGWSSVPTEGSECECTLTLPHSTCYRVRVSAVYGDITSKPSEETPVPVDVWIINLLERKSSILLEVLKLQTEKKPVELIDCTDEESEVKGFLQCLPYISQLRFGSFVFKEKKGSAQFLVNLIISASEFDTNKGENYTELLTSVCSYTSFPCIQNYTSHADQCDILLDLYSHVKDYESETGRSVLPALQTIYQSAPAVWRIKLSERKSSILLEVLKLQTEKKPVELIDWTDEESEVKGFLQCLPYISELRNAEQFIPSLCEVFGPTMKANEVTLLLQALDFTVTLSGKLPSSTCSSVGRFLGLSPTKLNLILKPQDISVRELKLLFKHIKHLQKLSLEDKMLVKLVRALRSFDGPFPVTTEELSLDTKDSKQNPSHILSSLTSLLSLLSVQCLDLTECKSEALSHIALLGLQEPLNIRFSKEALQQLVSVVYEAQDDELTRSFLKKVSKDLTSCSLTWEVIYYLLQHQALHLKTNFIKSKISCENIRELLPVLDRIQLKRLSPSFTLSIIMEIYETRFPQYVSSLMSSGGNYINLNGRVLDSVHCAALRFTLQHCNTVKLNLFWTSIPEEELESFLPLLSSRVKQLSVDRLLLLKLLRCCSSSDLQQKAADVLLSALHNRLDFSCCSALDLTDTQNQEHFKLAEKDCRVISSVLQKTQSTVKLVLQDCKLSDEALKLLWPILPRVQLSCSKALLLQFLACISTDRAERGSLRSAEVLSQALGGEMDLSHTQMDQRACEQLALFLEYSEGLTELDLSRCKLTDHCMEPLLPHLHKTQTLDLSHNNITDESAKVVHSVVCTHSNIQTVRLFGNKISDRKQFIGDKRFEIW